jgi:hypothetical protein
LFSEEQPKRTKPNKALKKMIFMRDKGTCRVCNEKVDPFNFEVGHDIAHSKGGKLTLQNAVLLCSICNKSMRTMSLKQTRKALGIPEPTSSKDEAKKILTKLSLKELKHLAKNHRIKVKGKVEEKLFSSSVLAPTKTQYVNNLSKELTKEQIEKELGCMPKDEPKPRKTTRKKNNSSSFFGF